MVLEINTTPHHTTHDSTRALPRLDSLAGIRCIAILLIVISHLSSYIPGVADYGIGANGVSLFIFLSGFLVAYTHISRYSGKNPIKWAVAYTKKKLGTFYFLHIIMFISALALLIVFALYSNSVTSEWIVTMISNGILNLTLMQNWVPDSSVYFSYNAVAWYLSITIFFYMMTPFIFHILAKINTRVKMIGLISGILLIELIWTVIFGNTSAAHAMIYIFPAYRLLEFILGCAFGKIFVEGKRCPADSWDKRISIKYTLLEVAAILAFVLAVLAWPYIPAAFGYSVFYVPFTVFLIYTFAFGRGFMSRIITNPVMLFISLISFEIFLIHQMVIRYLSAACSFVSIPDAVFVILSLAITIISSYLAHKYLPRIQRYLVEMYRVHFC